MNLWWSGKGGIDGCGISLDFSCVTSGIFVLVVKVLIVMVKLGVVLVGVLVLLVRIELGLCYWCQ